MAAETGGGEQEPRGPSGKKGQPEGVRLRQMTIDDLPGVFHLGEVLFSSSEAPNLYRTWDEWEVLELYKGDPDLCLVAREGESVVGFALGTTIEKRRSAWKYGHLVWLGVAPTHWRRGIAERLFRAIKEQMLAEGVRMVLVDTGADNAAGLAFFQQAGFGHPEGHVYLSLNLSSRRRQKGGDRRG